MCVDLSKPVFFACAQQLAKDFGCQEFGAVFLVGTKSDEGAHGFVQVRAADYLGRLLAV